MANPSFASGLNRHSIFAQRAHQKRASQRSRLARQRGILAKAVSPVVENLEQRRYLASTLLSGSNLACEPGWDSAHEGIYATDSSTASYYMSAASNNAWVGIDLGVGNSQSVNRVRFYPAPGFSTSLMVGGTFQSSTDAASWNTLYTITAAPGGSWNDVSFAASSPSRYFRYLAPATGSYGRLAELQFYADSSASAPAAPGNLSATASASGTQVNLSWSDNSSNETGFTVERQAGSNGVWSAVATLSANTTSYADTTVLPARSYAYRVRAAGSANDWVYSNVASVTAPGTMAKLTGTPTSSTAFNDSSTADKALDGNVGTYYLSLTSGTGWLQLDLGSSAAAAVSKIRFSPYVERETRLTGAVFQGSADGSAWTNLTAPLATPARGWNEIYTSSTQSFRYLRLLGPSNNFLEVAELEYYAAAAPGAPAAPGDLAMQSTGANAATLSWADNSDNESGFVIERQTGTTGTWAALATVGAGTQSYTDATVAFGRHYSYRVRALDSAGDWACSNIASFDAPGSFIKLSGTAIGSAPFSSSYPATAAFDGNTGTVYLSWAHTTPPGYVGLDLGAGNNAVVTRVRFYPVGGLESRVTGGKFQGSDDGSTYTDLNGPQGTVLAAPNRGWNELYWDNTHAYRYYRLLGAEGNYVEAAELEFYKLEGVAAIAGPTHVTAGSESTWTLSYQGSGTVDHWSVNFDGDVHTLATGQSSVNYRFDGLPRDVRITGTATLVGGATYNSPALTVSVEAVPVGSIALYPWRIAYLNSTAVSAAPSVLTPTNDGGVYFAAATGSGALANTPVLHYAAGVGTPSGPQAVHVYSGSGSVNPKNIANVSDVIFYNAPDGNGVERLWMINRHADSQAQPQIVSTAFSQPGSVPNVNGHALFSAISADTGQRELWISRCLYPNGDRSIRQTQKLLSATGQVLLNPDGYRGVNIGGTTQMYFAADDGTHGKELWVTDGTQAGTHMVADINSSGGSDPGMLYGGIAGDTNLYFTANDGTHYRELYVLTSPTATPQLINMRLEDGSGLGGLDFTSMAMVNGTLYFVANDGIHGREIYKLQLNGGQYTWAALPEIRAGNPGGRPNYLTALGNKLIFSADDNSTNSELWTYDTGTRAMAKIEIRPGLSIGSDPRALVCRDNLVYFVANDGADGAEVWATDGTTAKQVGDFAQGPASSDPQYIQNIGDQIYVMFAPQTEPGIYELWKVQDQPLPTLAIDHSTTLQEGTPIQFYGVHNNPDPGVTYAYHWEITGPGLAEPWTADTINCNFTPPDNGTYTATLTALVSGSLVATASVQIDVANVAPTATIGGLPQDPVPSGQEIELNAIVHDPGAIDAPFVYQWRVDGTLSGTSSNFSFTPGTASSYEISLVVTDKDGAASDPATADIAVAAPLQIAIAGNVTTNEGSVYTLSITASGWAASTTPLTVHWGDLDESVRPGNQVLAHTYADGLAFQTISVSGGAVTSNAVVVEVQNVAPTLTVSGDGSLTEQGLYTLTLDASDPGGDSISQWRIDWGDGQTALVVGTAPTAQHVYDKPDAAADIHVWAYDEDLSGGWLADVKHVSGYSVPVAPAAFEASANSASEVYLRWENHSAIATDLVIERAQDGGGFAMLDTIAASNSSYLDTAALEGHTYTYRIHASGAGLDSRSVEAGPVVPEAQSIAVSDLRGSSTLVSGTPRIDLTWNLVGSPSAVVVEYRLPGTNWAVLTSGNGQMRSACVSPALPSENYEFRVRAETDGMESAYQSYSIRSMDTLPATAADVWATVRGDDTITVRWSDMSDNEEGFRIYDEALPLQPVAEAPANATYVVIRRPFYDHRTPDVFRHMSVAPFSSSGEAAKSWTLSSLPQTWPEIKTDIAKPINVTAHLETDGTVTVSWRLQYENTNPFWGVVVESADTPVGSSGGPDNWMDFGTVATPDPARQQLPQEGSVRSNKPLVPGHNYYFRVWAYVWTTDAGGHEYASPYSDVVVVSPVGPSPATPTGLALVPAGAGYPAGAFTASWNPVAGATGYELEVHAVGSTVTNQYATTNTSLCLPLVQPIGRLQTVRVRAVKDGFGPWLKQRSVYSAEVQTLQTAPLAPSDFKAVEFGDTTIRLRWRNVPTNEERYELQSSTDGGATWSTDDWHEDADDTTTVYTTPDGQELLPGAMYNFRVRAVNSVGPSDWVQISARVPLPTVSVTSAPPTDRTKEGAGLDGAAIFTFTRHGYKGDKLRVFYQIDDPSPAPLGQADASDIDLPAHASIDGTGGTAKICGYVEIPVGEPSVDLPITAKVDGKLEPDETLILRLVSNSAYTPLAGASEAVVTIEDRDLVDVDIDSGNTAPYAGPSRTAAEDAIELDEPGKLLELNDNDDDHDGIPDYADGFNADGITDTPGQPGDDTNPNEQFVPVVIELSPSFNMNTGRLRLSYSASDPTLVDGTHKLPRGGGALRLWTGVNGRVAQSFQTRQGDGDTASYFVPTCGSGGGEQVEFYGLTDLRKLGFFGGFSLLAPNSDLRQVTLYVERVRNFDPENDGERLITVEVDPGGGGQFTATDAVRVGVPSVLDLDIDSDNNNGYDLPDRTGMEDQIEELLPGKALDLNTNDDDHDGVPDYADGYNFDQQSDTPQTQADDTNAAERFVPLVLELPRDFDPDNGLLSISYSSSDPAALGEDLSLPEGGGALRLWTAEQGRTDRSVRDRQPDEEGGFYVPASGEELDEDGQPILSFSGDDLRKLGFFGGYHSEGSELSEPDLSQRTITLYVERVRNFDSEIDSERQIRVSVDLDGTGQNLQSDMVVVGPKDQVDIDIDSDNTAPYAPPDHSDAEDNIEDDLSLPGKMLRVNNNDDDHDGIPDFADGYGGSWADDAGLADEAVANGDEQFVPLTIHLPPTFDWNSGSLQIVYSDSQPDGVTWSEGNGEQLPEGGGALRLWTGWTDGVERTGSDVRTRADDDVVDFFVPSCGKDDSYGPDDLKQMGFTPDTVNGSTATLYVEHVRPFAGDSERAITVNLDTDGTGYRQSDEVVVGEYIDLAIDSDNTSSALPERDAHEDEIEDDPSLPGKIIVTNQVDRDQDGIADLADGYNLDGQSGTADDVSTGATFVPLVIELPQGIDTSTIELSLGYMASDSTQVVGDLDRGFAPDPQSAGVLRVWAKDAWQHRDPNGIDVTDNPDTEEVEQPGDFVTPGGAFSGDSLAWMDDDKTGGKFATLYVEAVAPTTSIDDRTISLSINMHPLVQDSEFVPMDSVLVTAVNAQDSETSGAVRLSDGSASYSSRELVSNGYGMPWGQERTWTDAPEAITDNVNGNGWLLDNVPKLIQGTSTMIALIGDDSIFFDYDGTSYTPRFGRLEQLKKASDAGPYPGEYLLVGSDGNRYQFYGFGDDLEPVQRGSLDRFFDPAGNPTIVEYYGEGEADGAKGELKAITRGATSWTYTHLSHSEMNKQSRIAGLISSVKFVNSKGSRSATYDYYHGGALDQGNGNAGDLKLVTTYDGPDQQGTVLVKKLYRYELKNEDAPASERSRLTLVLEGDNYTRALQNLGNPELASSEALAPYASLRLSYSGGRVQEQIVQGAGASGGNDIDASGTYSYTYATNPDGKVGFNSWLSKTTETRPAEVLQAAPNKPTLTTYLNDAGQSLLSELSADGQSYRTAKKYDARGRVELVARPSAVSGVTPDNAYPASLYPEDGLVERTTYYAGGDGQGRVENTYVRRGETNAASEARVHHFDYMTRSGNQAGFGSVAVALVQADTVFRTEGGGGAQPTGHNYTQWKEFQPISDTITPPPLDDDQNSAGYARVTVIRDYDDYGRLKQQVDADSKLHTWQYDPDTGILLREEVDPRGLNLWSATDSWDLLGRPKHTRDWRGESTDFVYNDSQQLRGTWITPLWGTPTATLTLPAQGKVQHYVPGPITTGLVLSQEELLDSAGRALWSFRYPKSGVTYTTEYHYDGGGQLSYTKSADGAVRETVHDKFGRATAEKLASEEWKRYGYSDADGDLTTVTLVPGGTESDRITRYYYDWRDRLAATQDHDKIVHWDLDNLGQRTEQTIYSANVSNIVYVDGDPVVLCGDGLRARSGSEFDNRGQVYRTAQYEVDPQTGASNQQLRTQIFHDGRGNIVKTIAPGELVTTAIYDAAGRTTYQTVGTADLAAQWTLTQYSGNMTVVTTGQYWGGGPDRRSYVASYYDPAGRLTDTVNYGTNPDGATAPQLQAPERSGSFRRTSTTYTRAGLPQLQTDARGIETKYAYDNLGRKISEIINNTAPTTASDRTETRFEYNGTDALTKSISVLPGPGGSQPTRTTEMGYTSGFLMYTLYPGYDQAASAAEFNARSDTYEERNRLGEVTQFRDHNGPTHQFRHDAMGRVVSDDIISRNSILDESVLKRSYEYDAMGRLTLASSEGDVVVAGQHTWGVKNQVKRVYDGWGNVAIEYQEPFGAVSANTLAVRYDYAVVGGGVRLQRMRYPSTDAGASQARSLWYGYEGLDSALGRPTWIADAADGGNQILERYGYLGVSTVWSRSRPLNDSTTTQLEQTYNYGGLSQYGEVADLNWWTGGALAQRARYWYDLNGNVLAKENVGPTPTSPLFDYSEIYQENEHADANTAYDALNQMKEFDRGGVADRIDGRPVSVAETTTQRWGISDEGKHQRDSLPADIKARPVIQGAYLDADMMKAVDKWSAANGGVEPAKARAAQFDAWGNLAKLQLFGINWEGENYAWQTAEQIFGYDALGRRNWEKTETAVSRGLYSDLSGQLVEERQWDYQGHLTNTTQNVRSPVTGELVLRDRDTIANQTFTNMPTGIDERLYALYDGQGNISAITGYDGVVLERYFYTPEGQLTVTDAAGAQKTYGSDWSWRYYYRGGRWDAEGTYRVGTQERDSVLGGVLQNDPFAYWKANSGEIRPESLSIWDRVQFGAAAFVVGSVAVGFTVATGGAGLIFLGAVGGLAGGLTGGLLNGIADGHEGSQLAADIATGGLAGAAGGAAGGAVFGQMGGSFAGFVFSGAAGGATSGAIEGGYQGYVASGGTLAGTLQGIAKGAAVGGALGAAVGALTYGAVRGGLYMGNRMLIAQPNGAFDAWLADGASGGLRRNLGAIRLNNFRNSSTRFYSVQDPLDTARLLLCGGEPWPTGLARGNMGPGLYAWANRADAVKYLSTPGISEASDLNILSFRVANYRLSEFSTMDLTQMPGTAVDEWMAVYSYYGSSNPMPHGYQHVIRASNIGVEHLFAPDVYPMFQPR